MLPPGTARRVQHLHAYWAGLSWWRKFEHRRGGTEAVKVSITSISTGYEFDKWHFVDGNVAGNGALASPSTISFCFATENNTNRTYIAFVKVANDAPVADDETVTAAEDADARTRRSATLLARRRRRRRRQPHGHRRVSDPAGGTAVLNGQRHAP